MATDKPRVAEPAEPDQRTIAAAQAKTELEAASPAPAGTTLTPAGPILFDYAVEYENHLDALKALLRVPYVFLDNLSPRMAKFARAVFRNADSGAPGLAQRWTKAAERAVMKGEQYNADRWALLATAGAFLQGVLQEAGEEKAEAERKAAEQKAAAAANNRGVPQDPAPPAGVPA